MSDTLTLVPGAIASPGTPSSKPRPHGHFFQTWEWGELQADLSAPPTRIAAMRGDRIVGALQMLMFETGPDRRFGFVPRGPAADPADVEVVDALVGAAIELAAAAGAHSCSGSSRSGRGRRRRSRFSSGTGSASPSSASCRCAPRWSTSREPADEVFAGFHSNTRNRIRLAQKQGVEVRIGQPEEMETFLALFDETTTRHGMRKADTDAMRLSAKHFGHRDAMRPLPRAPSGRRHLRHRRVHRQRLGHLPVGRVVGRGRRAQGEPEPAAALDGDAMGLGARPPHRPTSTGSPTTTSRCSRPVRHRQTGGMWNLYAVQRGFGVTVHRHVGMLDCVFAKRAVP